MSLSGSSRCCSDIPTLCHMTEPAVAATVATGRPLEGIADSLSASSASLSPTCAHRSIRVVPAAVALLLLVSSLPWIHVDDLRLRMSGRLLPLALYLRLLSSLR